ncbi:MAG: hypothetical protein LBT14_10195 [Treponema sp.]|jgi:hypothetical protein|nr:hypothetical protein [Treponema sp.]
MPQGHRFNMSRIFMPPVIVGLMFGFGDIPRFHIQALDIAAPMSCRIKSGGLIAAFIRIVFPQAEFGVSPELLFKVGLLRKHFSLVAIEIVSRIPVNIIDRIIAAFGGYGIAWVLAWINQIEVWFSILAKKLLKCFIKVDGAAGNYFYGNYAFGL